MSNLPNSIRSYNLPIFLNYLLYEKQLQCLRIKLKFCVEFQGQT